MTKILDALSFRGKKAQLQYSQVAWWLRDILSRDFEFVCYTQHFRHQIVTSLIPNFDGHLTTQSPGKIPRRRLPQHSLALHARDVKEIAQEVPI